MKRLVFVATALTLQESVSAIKINSLPNPAELLDEHELSQLEALIKEGEQEGGKS